MSKQLAFALINPYTISKSRTGGVIGRLLTRTGLDLVAARMFAPSEELVRQYADLVRNDPTTDEIERGILADYILRNYAPDPRTGKRRRVMMLLFEGDDAVARVARATGRVRLSSEASDTIRGTYGDFVCNGDGQVRYVEPAIMVGWTLETVAAALRLWAAYSDTDGGVVEHAGDVPVSCPNYQRTLVLLKPDNFLFPSGRPGNIIDILSASGLRIIGAKVHRMSVQEAEEFYAPVREILREKLKPIAASRAAAALAKELEFEITPEVADQVGELLAPLYAENQFNRIVQFMTGYWRPSCSEQERYCEGRQRCLALIYAGADAVAKIRNLLGPTDPNKALPGQVRREFGRDTMVNAAHASDSPENAEREMRIVRVEENLIPHWVKKYYPEAV